MLYCFQKIKEKIYKNYINIIAIFLIKIAKKKEKSNLCKWESIMVNTLLLLH